jgi:hypothetical protein
MTDDPERRCCHCRRERKGLRLPPTEVLMAGARNGNGFYGVSSEHPEHAALNGHAYAILPGGVNQQIQEVQSVTQKKATAAATKAIAVLEGPVNLAGLKLLPEPKSLGPRHKPVQHFEVVEALEAKLRERGLDDFQATYVLSKEGMRLDARYSLDPRARAAGEAKMKALRPQFAHYIPKELQEVAGASLVMTHANDKSRALRIVTAMEVFICTNLAIAPSVNGAGKARKHTGDEPWEERIALQLEQAFANFEPFGANIRAMQEATLTDEQAGGLIVQVMRLNYQPVATSSFMDVVDTYFAHATPDVAEPTRWSLHNAFTRVMRETPLKRQVETSSDLLRILTESLPIEPTFISGN